MEYLRMEADLVINLIELCNERSLPTSFTREDIEEILVSDSSLKDKVRTLNRVHTALREILYAPPG